MRWCEGLPEKDTRRLTRAEAERLREIGQGSTRPRAVLAFLALIVWPGAVAVAVGLGRWDLATFPFIGFVLLGLPLGMAWALRAWSLGRALEADLREGLAVEFGGPGVELAVLPRSGILVSRDGVPGESSRRLTITRAVAVPELAIPEPDALEHQAGAPERALTLEERDARANAVRRGEGRGPPGTIRRRPRRGAAPGLGAGLVRGRRARRVAARGGDGGRYSRALLALHSRAVISQSSAGALPDTKSRSIVPTRRMPSRIEIRREASFAAAL